MLICLSVSYKHASLPILESLAINEEVIFAQLFGLENNVKECVLIQTCHRVEIYCISSASDQSATINKIVKIWSTSTGVSSDIIAKFIQTFYEKDAMAHLFYLTSGLESMVLGEDQIIGQVRRAFLTAKKRGMIGQQLEGLFLKAISVGKRVRTKTKINKGSVSISSAAVDLASSELGDLKSRRVLVVGAGEAGTLAAQALKSHGVSSIGIANRTLEKSEVLAEKVSGYIVPFSDVRTAILSADLVISALSVETPFFTKQDLAPFIINNPRSKQILIIDISQPRAVEKNVGLLRGIRLQTIDDLKKLVDQNLQNRTIAAEQSKMFIAKELIRFEKEILKNTVQPLISEILRSFEEIRSKELKRAIRKMGTIDEKKRRIMDRFSKEIIERVAQKPISGLRKAALAGDDNLLEAATRLFQTKTEKEESSFI